MAKIGVDIAIVQDGRILLTQREDSAAWCLPGGGVELGESLVQAAARECREETGLEVEVTHLVGIYSRPNWPQGGGYELVFAARHTGGSLKQDTSEVLAIGYFGPDELPEPIFWGHRPRIADALAGIGGSIVRVRDTRWPFEHIQDRQSLYAARDRSGLPRSEAYLQIAALLGSDEARIEVPGQLVAR